MILARSLIVLAIVLDGQSCEMLHAREDPNVEYIMAVTSEREKIQGAEMTYGRGPFSFRSSEPNGSLSGVVYINPKSIFAWVNHKSIRPTVDKVGLEYYVLLTENRLQVFRLINRTLYDQIPSQKNNGQFREIYEILPIHWSSIGFLPSRGVVQSLLQKHDSTIEVISKTEKLQIHTRLLNPNREPVGVPDAKLVMSSDFFPVSFQWPLGKAVEMQTQTWDWREHSGKPYLSSYKWLNSTTGVVRLEFASEPVDETTLDIKTVCSTEELIQLIGDGAEHHTFGPDFKTISSKFLGNPSTAKADFERAVLSERLKRERKQLELKN